MILLLFNFATFDTDFKLIAEEMVENGCKMVYEILCHIDGHSIDKNKETARIIQQYANGVMFQLLASTNPEIFVEDFEKNIDDTIELFLNQVKKPKENP